MYLLTIILVLHTTMTPVTHTESLVVGGEECAQLGTLTIDRLNRLHYNFTAHFVCEKVGDKI